MLGNFSIWISEMNDKNVIRRRWEELVFNLCNYYNVSALPVKW